MQFGLGIYARKFIPAGTPLGFKGHLGRMIENRKDDLSDDPLSIYKSILTITYVRTDGVKYDQNHLLYGTAAMANYACANHANIIGNYNHDQFRESDYWNNFFSIKDINENDQLLFSWIMPARTLTCAASYWQRYWISSTPVSSWWISSVRFDNCRCSKEKTDPNQQRKTFEQA